MHIKFQLVIFFLLSVFCSQAQYLKNDSSVVKKTLDNGFTYYLKKNTYPKNRIELKLAVKTGSVNERSSEQGIAHFLEHMAFNGSENFPKNEIINYIESCGMGFGSDLNAYTSFTETVYRFTLPSDSLEYLSTGLNIIRDWTNRLDLEASEIDREKGVIKEEWRLGKGLGDRLMKKIIPVLLSGSNYAKRLPIGKLKVIEKANSKQLRAFYEKWYRPENMSLIVVGDIDVESLEKEIISKFSSLSKSKKISIQKHELPEVLTGKFLLVSDDEISALNLDMYIPMPFARINTYDTYKESLKFNLLNRLFINRFEDLNSKENLPFRYSNAFYSSVIPGVDCFNMSIGLKYDNIKAGIIEYKRNIDQINKYGFLDIELENVKKDFKNNLKMSLANKENQNSSSLANEYLSNFLMSTSYLSVDDYVDVSTKIIDEINADDLHSILTSTLEKKFSTILQSKEGKLPSSIQDSISKWWKTEFASEKYILKINNKPLLSVDPIAGKIIKTEYLKSVDLITWTLSNGIKVTCKNVGNRKNFIAFAAYKNGGISLLADSLVNAGRNASRFIENMGYGGFSNKEMTTKLAGKQAYSSIFIGDNTTNMIGYCDTDNMQTMFDLLYLNFTFPNIDKVQFEKTKISLIDGIKNKSLEPSDIFSDSLRYKINGVNRFNKKMSIADINNISIDDVMMVNKYFTSNANGYHFFFTGDVDTLKLKPFVEKYIASLPSFKENIAAKDLKNRLRKSRDKFVLRLGKEEKSSVRLIFTGEKDFSTKSQMLTSLSFDILQQILNKKIREDLSLTYSINSYGSIDTYPIDQYIDGISFGCAPQNVDIAIEEIWKLINNMDEETIDKFLARSVLKAKRSFEKNKQWHGYWLAYLSGLSMNNTRLDEFVRFDDYWDSFTAKDVLDLFRKELTKTNYLEAILLPEN